MKYLGQKDQKQQWIRTQSLAPHSVYSHDQAGVFEGCLLVLLDDKPDDLAKAY